MKRLRSRIAIDGLVYPESIRWHRDRLWFSDILDRRVYHFDPETDALSVVFESSDDQPSGLGFLPDGTPLVAMMRSRQLLRLDADGPKVAADLSTLCELLNDMVVDALGRAYVDGHFAHNREGGGILLATLDGSGRVAASAMKAPNGMILTPDGKTLLANDLLGNSVLAFNIAADGSLAGRRIHADLGVRSPDGLCLDADGGIWVGLPFQNKFQRIDRAGTTTHEIDVGDKWGTAPILGGCERRTLYMCTAKVAPEDMPVLLKDPTGARAKCKGWIEFVDDIDVAGVG